MSSRNQPRYDDSSRRETREAREARESRDPRDPRDPREIRAARESRDPRDPREIRTTRESRDPRDPRDIRDPREVSGAKEIISPREGREVGENIRVDSRTETRIDPSRMDPRADPRFLSRGDPRGDIRGEPRPDPRGDIRLDHREIRDARDAREYRSEPMIETRDPRYATTREPREARDTRDPRDPYGRDEMDIDPPPTGRLASYFLPGEGISREVIQADICRYLGADATCMPHRNREGVPGYMVRAYRMLTTKMIEDLMADSKRWDEELRRSRHRGTRPAYEDTEIHERRQITGPSQSTSAFPGPQSRMRERDDYDMDDYGRAAPPPQRTLFPTSMAPEYQPSYPVTSAPFQNPSMTAPPEYVIARGQTDGYGQVPRSEYEMYAASAAGRGVPLQPPNPGQFASQQGLQGQATYQDPRTGQMIYPPTSAGRGFDQPSARHTNAADGRRR